MYRSPSNNSQKFRDLYEQILQKLNKYKSKHTIISGDFNIDLIKHETDIFSQNLLDLTTKHGFAQAISRPTRITDTSATLIDHVYTNTINKVLTSSVITLDLTDHLATTITISLDAKFDCSTWREIGRIYSNKKPKTYRIFNDANSEKFRELVNNETWELPDGLDSQQQYNHLQSIYMEHYNTAFPLNKDRIRRKKERIDPKPWILPWLEEASDRKNRLYFEWVKEPTAEKGEKYKKLKTFVEKHVKKAKEKYYSKFFLDHKNNSKKQWQMINSLLNRKNG